MPKRPKCSDLICDLGRVNQILDLCIDRELYDYVDGILELSDKAKEYINFLKTSKGKKSLEKFGFDNFEFPVEKITISPSIIPSLGIRCGAAVGGGNRQKRGWYKAKNL